MYSIKSFENGFEYIDVQNDVASAKIALQGAHIFEFKRGSEDLLWVSEESAFELGKAICGGVPLCWPRFGSLDTTLPQHGFARTEMFTLKSVKELDKENTEIIFQLTENKNTLAIWNYNFKLEFRVVIGKALIMELKTTNSDTQTYMITQALHTYFPVSHISEARVEGLEKKPYFDAVNSKNFVQEGEIYFTQEINRVYQDVENILYLKDKRRKISIKNRGSSSVVVWNPAKEKCKKMSGFKENSYENFVCIESANAFDDFRMIKPKENHTICANIF